MGMNNAKGGTMNGHPIGTRVRIVRSQRAERVGLLATVLSGVMLLEKTNGVYPDNTLWQHIDIDGVGSATEAGIRIGYPPEWLEPLPPDSIDTDATPNAVASWAGGVWTPHRERV
jgi:hypothetical protein